VRFGLYGPLYAANGDFICIQQAGHVGNGEAQNASRKSYVGGGHSIYAVMMAALPMM
jgi:hypothetical protein